VPANVAALARDLAFHREDLLTTGGIARLLFAKAKEQPINVAHLFLTKAVQSWYGNDSHTHEKWAALIQLFYLPLFASWGRAGVVARPPGKELPADRGRGDYLLLGHDDSRSSGNCALHGTGDWCPHGVSRRRGRCPR
jgi:hypothetical protein